MCSRLCKDDTEQDMYVFNYLILIIISLQSKTFRKINVLQCFHFTMFPCNYSIKYNYVITNKNK